MRRNRGNPDSGAEFGSAAPAWRCGTGSFTAPRVGAYDGGMGSVVAVVSANRWADRSVRWLIWLLLSVLARFAVGLARPRVEEFSADGIVQSGQPPHPP